jgi:MFS family permease
VDERQTAKAEYGGAERRIDESDFSPRKLKIAFGVMAGQIFATSILPFAAMSLVLLPMTSEFGWTRTEFSFATTCIFFFGSVSLWPIGRIADKFGVRPILFAGTAVVGLVTLAMSMQTKSLTMLYVLYSLLGIFGSTGVVYMKIIAATFTKNRGKAMAILGAESMAATALVPLLTNWLLLTYGWRSMYLVFGIIILTIIPILYLTLEEPDRIAAGGSAPNVPPPVLEGMTIGQALRDRVFWMATLGGMAGMVVLTGMVPHMIPALIGKGFTQTQAVATSSFGMLAGLVGNLAGGYAVDRFNTAKIGAPFALISALGAFLLLKVTGTFGGWPMLVASVALGWFTFGAYRPMGTYFQTRFFGLRSFNEIAAVQFTIINPISAFAAPLIGNIYDRTHSYDIAFMLMVASGVFAALIWLALPKYRYGANIGANAPAPAEAAIENDTVLPGRAA